MTTIEPYFHALGDGRYRATRHVQGAWSLDEQHIAAPLGLLTHVVEVDHRRRRGDLVISRLSFDILGIMPIGDVDLTAEVTRAGRTIELVEGTLSYGGRAIVRLRAWFTTPADTGTVAGTGFDPIPPVSDHEAWDPTREWAGGYIASAEVRRLLREPGRGSFWVRSPHPLVDDEPVSPLAHAARVFDIANGMSTRIDPARLAYPNLDLTAHLFREPRGEWVGFDTSVSFGPTGVGLTSSVLHDEDGPFGALNQSLTLRPR
ncbi:thioesterase [Gordonia spumicola]|uniref:Thioesterase n=1 Tax=Gordonia spumicola TaxID=589161 RepID=A0A7I9VDT2_9ACTN|nr:thioesterase family protein [Gordonia spumicola]GEE03467.1 thioesterase [Gordonia spumicola]